MLAVKRPKTNTIEEIVKLCNAAVAKQAEQNKRGGFGLDDYTDGRTIGGASLARNILRLIYETSRPA